MMTMLTARAAMFYFLCYVCCTVLYLCVFFVLHSMVAATLSLVTPAMRNHLMGALPFELGSLLGGTYGMTQHIPHFLSPFPPTSFLLPCSIFPFLRFLFLLTFSPPLSALLLTSFLLPRSIYLFFRFLFLLIFSPPLSPLLLTFFLTFFLSFFLSLCLCLFRSAVPSQGEGGVQHDRHPSRSLHHSPAPKQVTATLYLPSLITYNSILSCLVVRYSILFSPMLFFPCTTLSYAILCCPSSY
jgi:hypothetical protein